VRYNHVDLAVIKAWTADSQILILSVYIPPIPIHTSEGRSAEAALSAIYDKIQKFTRSVGRSLAQIKAWAQRTGSCFAAEKTKLYKAIF
jgi:hypothetical protein